jgi:hypothetical protein
MVVGGELKDSGTEATNKSTGESKIHINVWLEK